MNESWSKRWCWLVAFYLTKLYIFCSPNCPLNWHMMLTESGIGILQMSFKNQNVLWKHFVEVQICISKTKRLSSYIIHGCITWNPWCNYSSLDIQWEKDTLNHVRCLLRDRIESVLDKKVDIFFIEILGEYSFTTLLN